MIGGLMFDQCPDEIYSISSIRWRAAFSMMIEKPKFPLDNLPEELIIKIASYLGEKDLFTLSHLNRKAFRVLAKAETIWKSLLRKFEFHW